MTTMTRQDPARQRITRTFRSFSHSLPFFFHLAIGLDIVRDDAVRNIASDGQTLRYNGEWVLNAQADDIRHAIAHVVTACALKHHTRRGDRSQERWQRASRLVTAPILESAGIDAGIDRNYNDMSAEQVYAVLPEDERDQDDPLGDVLDYTGGDGDGESDGEDDPEATPSAGGPSRTEIDRQERDWDRRMHQAAAFSRAAGNRPGTAEEMVSGMHRSRAPWRDLLRDFMAAVAHTDYTWRRPARRFVGSGIYLPSLHSEGLGPIVLAIDTSGSMDADTLGQVWSEVRQIAEDMRPERITVIECDHAIQTVTDYEPDDIPAEYLAHGRGGTSTRPVFEWVDAHYDDTPAALIYYSDLYVSANDYAAGDPGYPVLWAAYGAPPAELTPPWGMRLDIGD